MKSYKLYIFDLDDTLINTYETVSKNIYSELAFELALPTPSKEIIHDNWGKDIFESLNNIFQKNMDENKVIAMLEKLHQKFNVEAFNGVIQILNLLKKHNKFIGIFSSSHPSIMDICLNNNFKHISFDYIFNTKREIIEKPSKQIVKRIRQFCQNSYSTFIQNEEIVIIGDSLKDYETALSASVDFYAVTTGVTEKTQFVEYGLDPIFIYPSIADAIVAPDNHGVVAIIINNKNEFLLVKDGRKDNPYYEHWSGPHGQCQKEDVIEEETVTRETKEECNINVIPVKRLYTRPADTKAKTVTFWETIITDKSPIPLDYRNREVSDIQWISFEDIKNGKVKLYPGTKDFFNKYCG